MQGAHDYHLCAEEGLESAAQSVSSVRLTVLAYIPVLFAMTSSDAVITLLNSPSATSAKEFAAAKQMVEADAKAGKPIQQFVVGLFTDDKEQAKVCFEKSRAKIHLAAERYNNPLAWYLLSLENNDMAMLRKAADLGNVQALNALGTIEMQEISRQQTWTTNSCDESVKRSYQYFCRAAKERDPNGFVNLGLCHLRGLGCEKNVKLAFQCFRSAAEAGHSEGMDYVAKMYRNGEGVARSESRALYWEMRARARRGDEAAEEWLRSAK